MTEKEDQWDPSRDIAEGSVSANAAKLFGGDAFVKKGKSPVSSPARPKPQSVPSLAKDPAEDPVKDPSELPRGVDSGPSPGGGDQWDPSRDIAAGSVSANAAKLFGAGGALSGAGGTKPKKKKPTLAPVVAEKTGEDVADESKEKEDLDSIRKAEEAVAAAKKKAEEATAAKKKVEEAAAKAKKESALITQKETEEEAITAKKEADEAAAKTKSEADAAELKKVEEESLAAKKRADEAAAKAKAEADAAKFKKANLEKIAWMKKADEEAAAKAKAKADADKLKKAEEAAKMKAEEAEAAAMTKKTAAADAKKQADGEVVAAKKKAEELLARANAAEAETKKRRAEEKDRAAMLAKLKESRKLLLGRFDVSGSDGQPMRCTDNEILIRAIDVNSGAGVGKPVVLQLLSDPKRLESELQARSSEDEDDIENTKSSHIIQVLDVLCDSSQSVSLPSQSPFQINYLDGLAEELQTLLKTHGNSSQYDASGDQYSSDPYVTDEMVPYPCLLVLEHYDQTLGSHTDRFPRPNLRLARGVAADVVVGLMMLHTEGKVHRDLSPRSIMRSTGSEDDDGSDDEGSGEKANGMWKIAGLGCCGRVGEMVQKPGDLSGDWGYLPPEAATVIVEQGSGEDQGVTTDPSWDLWALGCVLYRLVFGSDLWTISRGGQISDEDLAKLSNWSKLDIWKRAAIAFPRESRTDGERAAIDLVAKLLAPTPEERMNNFEFGIISVHQHEFVEGIALEPETLAAFRATQELVAVEEADLARYDAIAEKLSLEESWELSRARSVLLLGAFEPIHVHAPTSFVILKKPLSSDGRSGESALKEGMRWASMFNKLGPLVRGALLNNDVGAVGRFWAQINGLYRGNYVYMYLVDDMTGEPVTLPPDQSFIGHGVPYPVQIKTRSDVLPKLLPLMHLTMRSAALYHGATGIARLFGGGPSPSLSSDVRKSAQGTVDDLKHEQGNAATEPFGSFVDDVSRAKENRERFLRDDTNVRCRSLVELVRLYERKGLVVPGKPRGNDDFVGLQRLADTDGLALWTLLDDVDEFRAAVKKRAEERLKEEKKLWGDSMEGRIDELEDALANSGVGLSVSEGDGTSTDDAASRASSLRSSKTDGQRIKSLEMSLKQTTAELEESKKKTEALEKKLAASEERVNSLMGQVATW